MARYIGTSRIYDEGIDPADYPPGRVRTLIDIWQEFLERATGQFFESRTLDFKVDGSGCSILWFQIPILTLTELYVNEDFDNEVDLTTIRVYNRTPQDSSEDDRQNPRIAFEGESASIFRAAASNIFERGHANQQIKGTFGYLENGECPEPIKYALTRLVINNLGKLGEPGTGPADPLAGLVKEEKTDGHSIKYASLFESVTPKREDFLSIVQDPIINGILKMYRAPRLVRMVYSTVDDPEV